MCSISAKNEDKKFSCKCTFKEDSSVIEQCPLPQGLQDRLEPVNSMLIEDRKVLGPVSKILEEDSIALEQKNKNARRRK
jgi:hypothetical protein